MIWCDGVGDVYDGLRLRYQAKSSSRNCTVKHQITLNYCCSDRLW
ncbi:hypothetical protein [Nostoc sp. FACHB-133]|nr:hypothetical protein [Nostoc sp. FACHB-133]